eukprot:comp14966_c1_seq1/m.11565 comp14966_c1_seq1/g.11565  ORF comp14966_c1_seq1/g.11565 comp14966_c1_seq1/m.11565 type:complete len:270 (-) comp14966_c1_seq1:94-903(-)
MHVATLHQVAHPDLTHEALTTRMMLVGTSIEKTTKVTFSTSPTGPTSRIYSTSLPREGFLTGPLRAQKPARDARIVRTNFRVPLAQTPSPRRASRGGGDGDQPTFATDFAITQNTDTVSPQPEPADVHGALRLETTALAFDPRTYTLRGTLRVRWKGDLGQGGSVFIRHTQNKWRTHKDEATTRVLREESGESFYFSIQLEEGQDSEGETVVEYAVCCCHDAGWAHWENNGGNNFLVAIRTCPPRRPTLERPRSLPHGDHQLYASSPEC